LKFTIFKATQFNVVEMVSQEKFFAKIQQFTPRLQRSCCLWSKFLQNADL